MKLVRCVLGTAALAATLCCAIAAWAAGKDGAFRLADNPASAYPSTNAYPPGNQYPSASQYQALNQSQSAPPAGSIPPTYGPAFAPPTYVPAQAVQYAGPVLYAAPVGYAVQPPEPIAPPAVVESGSSNSAAPSSAAGASSISSLRTTSPSVCNNGICERMVESSWYSKIEYFHWNERIDNADFENENGPLWTLGYMHRFGDERIRLEVFDSQVDSSSDIVDNSGIVEPLHSHTNYFGVRGEYDLLWNPETLPSLSFFTGIGTRFWVRDLPDDFTPSGTFVEGYQETWWTFYPYVGMETRRTLNGGGELYGMGRMGFTAITLERATVNDLALYPRLGFTGQLEGGVRGKSLFLAAFAEVMNWQQSGEVRGWLQPTSTMVTVGLRTGSTF